MKIIFFGLGSIGLRHAGILQKFYNHKLYAFRTGKSQFQNNLKIAELLTWKEVEKLKPDVAFITNPTSLHIETAIKCAELNCSLFIEKPIGDGTKNLSKLLKLVKRKNLTTFVGYQLRFHPVIKELKEYLKKKKPIFARAVNTSYLPLWRKGIDHKKKLFCDKRNGWGSYSRFIA